MKQEITVNTIIEKACLCRILKRNSLELNLNINLHCQITSYVSAVQIL